MENRETAAGRRKLTPEQMDNLVRVACEISEINSIIEKVHPENGWKKTVVLHGGHDEVANTISKKKQSHCLPIKKVR